MKMLTAIVMLMLAISSFASSTSRTFFYDGTQDSVMMSLRAEKTHTEYRYEQRQTICYRQEVFYRHVCHPTPQGPICQTVPEYRTVSFPCIQTVRVPYEVKDYDVEANVNLNVANMSEIAAGETFRVTLDGDRLYVSASGSKRFFILLKKEAISETMSGSVKFMDATFGAELVEAAPIVNALNMTDISLKNSVLSFKTGPVAVRDVIGFRLNVKKAPILGSDTVLFDRELAPAEIQLNAQGEGSSVDVNIQKLGVGLSLGRYTITATTFFKHEGTIINASDFEKTEASRTLIYKIR